MRKLNKILSMLRKKVPTQYPVVVKFVKSNDIKGYYGMCEFIDGYYLITLARGDVHMMIFTLIHEYAHTLVEHERHDEEWGKAYSICWNAYTGEY